MYVLVDVSQIKLFDYKHFRWITSFTGPLVINGLQQVWTGTFSQSVLQENIPWKSKKFWTGSCQKIPNTRNSRVICTFWIPRKTSGSLGTFWFWDYQKSVPNFRKVDSRWEFISLLFRKFPVPISSSILIVRCPSKEINTCI